MSYETRAYDKPNDDGFPSDPVVILVATGTHDVSRLVNLLAGSRMALCEHGELAHQIRRQVKRHSGGREALKLLAHHGGPDLLEIPDRELAAVVKDATAKVKRLTAERANALDALSSHGRAAVEISGDLQDGIDADHRMSAAEREGLLEEIANLRAALNERDGRVRELHSERKIREHDPITGHATENWLPSICTACSDPDLIEALDAGELIEAYEGVMWPCPTIHALDGSEPS